MPPKRKAKEPLSPGGPMGFVRQTTKGNNTKGNNTKGKGKAREATADPDGEDEDEYQPQPQPKKAATKRPAAKRARKDSSPDDGPDFGGAPKRSTIEQHLMEQNKKSKEFIQGFKAQVAERESKAKDGVAKLREELHKSHESRQDDLKALFRTFGDEDSKRADLKENPLFQMTEKLFGISRGVMERHRGIEKEVEEQAKKLVTPREEWMRDGEQMRELIKYGRGYGVKTVGDMVGGGSGEGEKEDQGRELTRVEEVGRGMFKRSVNAVDKVGSWGQIARGQVEALSEVMRVVLKGVQRE